MNDSYPVTACLNRMAVPIRWLLLVGGLSLLAACSGSNGSAPKPARNISLQAWVGDESSELSLSAGAEGGEFYAARNPDCDFDHYKSCDTGEMDVKITTGNPFTSQALTLSQPAHFQLRRQGQSAEADISASRFSGREEHQAVYFNDQFWVIGGRGNDGLNNEVWSSADGSNWFLRKAKSVDDGPLFSARARHEVVVFDADDGAGEQLWLIGGEDVSGSLNDVWSSADGVTWEQVTDQAAFAGRDDYQVVVFDSPDDEVERARLWLVGGDASDVWVSDNGKEWSLVGVAPVYNSEHQVVVFDAPNDEFGEQLWFIGGYSSRKALFSSSDGIDWVSHTAQSDGDTAFPGYNAHQVVVYDNKLWLIGGAADGERTQDVWSSADGVTWHLEIDAAAFPARAYHQVVVAKNQLWLIGGNDLNDVWSSTDGTTWTLLSNGPDGPEFSARAGHQVVVFDGGTGEKLWLIGGYSYEGITNDVWSSVDGVSWTQEVAHAGFSPRYYHQVVVFDNRLWLVGGRTENGPKSDVWSSADGKVWVDQTAATGATFEARSSHQLVVFDDKLWMIGGYDHINLKRFKDVWSLSKEKGDHWQQEPTFPVTISYHQALVFDGQLFVLGGYQDELITNDIWSRPSGEGKDWLAHPQGDNKPHFTKRYSHQAAVYHDAIWVVGGYDDVSKNDVWKYSRKSNTEPYVWQEVTEQAAFARRYAHQLVNYKDQLSAIGGYGSGTYLADVWRSTDGKLWQQGVKTQFNFPEH